MENIGERHIGKPIYTTMLDIVWHIEEIEKKFDILEIRNTDESNRDGIFAVTDPVNEYLTGNRIWSVCYTFNRRVYLADGEKTYNKPEILEYLRTKGKRIRMRDHSAETMLEKDERTLFSLFLYAVKRIDDDEFAYNNINGCLFQTYKSWVHKTKLHALQYSVRTSVLGRHKLFIEMKATSMSALKLFSEEDRKVLFKRAQYRFEDNEFHRVYDCKLSNFTIKKAPSADNAKIAYLDLKKKDKYHTCKVNNFNILIARLNSKFRGMLEVSPAAMTIVNDIPTDKDLLKDFVRDLLSKVNDYEYNIVDKDKDEETGKTATMAASKLKKLFDIDATLSDDVVSGKFNIRIIHNPDFYNGGYDPHNDKFPGETVQHMTVEDFGNGDDSIQDAALFNVIIKELFIKYGNLKHFDILGKWGERGYTEDYIFITRWKIGKLYYCFKHVMKTDGSMESDLIRDDDPMYDICGTIWPYSEKTSEIEYAIVKGQNICTITNTHILPIPDKEIMDEAMEHLGGGKGSGRAGKGPRGRETVDKTLYSTLDIKRLDYDGKLLYLCGYSSANIINQEKGPNIRLVECRRGENFFDEIMKEMEVPFVRYGQLTVVPYPFKYLSEFIERYKNEHKEEFETEY